VYDFTLTLKLLQRSDYVLCNIVTPSQTCIMLLATELSVCWSSELQWHGVIRPGLIAVIVRAL